MKTSRFLSRCFTWSAAIADNGASVNEVCRKIAPSLPSNTVTASSLISLTPLTSLRARGVRYSGLVVKIKAVATKAITAGHAIEENAVGAAAVAAAAVVLLAGNCVPRTSVQARSPVRLHSKARNFQSQLLL